MTECYCDINHFCTSCIGNNVLAYKDFFPSTDDCQRKRKRYYALIEEYAGLYADKERWTRFKNRIKEDQPLWNSL